MSENEMEPVEAENLVEGKPAEEETENIKTAPVETLRILEALLFASDELLTAARIKAILPGTPDAREIGKMVERINHQLQKERHPFEIVEIGGGYQFKTIAYYHPWVRQIFQEKAARRLSIQALECLSIIAYRQPLSKAEIETIRGVLSDGAMKTLLEKRLITITGRSEKPGRPLLYGTTPEFLTYFGLNKIGDLPKIEEFEALVRQKMENMPIEELKEVPVKAEGEAEGAVDVGIEGETAEQVVKDIEEEENVTEEYAEKVETIAEEEKNQKEEPRPSGEEDPATFEVKM
jgi:segregation and condensation protein B